MINDLFSKCQYWSWCNNVALMNENTAFLLDFKLKFQISSLLPVSFVSLHSVVTGLLVVCLLCVLDLSDVLCLCWL